MPHALRELIRFRSDKLFNGAVNVDWFGSDESRASLHLRLLYSMDPNTMVYHKPMLGSSTVTNCLIRRVSRCPLFAGATELKTNRLRLLLLDTEQVSPT